MIFIKTADASGLSRIRRERPRVQSLLTEYGPPHRSCVPVRAPNPCLHLRLAALGRRRHTRREAIARVLVNALRLAQAAQVRSRGGGGMLAVGVLACEEEALAYRPRELVVISTRAADGDVRVRAARVRVLAPV